MIRDLAERIRFWKNADRVGPDILLTHWMLYYKSSARKLCKSKFKHFDDTAEFRPGAYAFTCSNISIGRRVVIRPNTVLHGGPSTGSTELVIEDDVLLGGGIHIYSGYHNFEDPNIPIIEQGFGKPEAVILKKGCWIGANAIILKGVTIGEHAVVGAGSIVTKSVPPLVVVAGNPAKVIRKL